MAAPVNSVLPAITGTVLVGEALACDSGTWTGGVQSYAYQWQRVDPATLLTSNISGATASAYVITAEDCHHTLQCVVTATNNTGSTAASSAATTEVPDDYFVAEDGTGLANANSLATLEEADSYIAVRRMSGWFTYSHGQRKSALIQATDYIELRWGKRGRFKGAVQFPDTPQALSFPRLYIGHDGEVPQDIRHACAEYALRALAGALAPDPTVTVGAAVESVRKKVGPIETETRYSNGGNPGAVVLKPYPAADMLVRPYLLGSGLVRA